MVMTIPSGTLSNDFSVKQVYRSVGYLRVVLVVRNHHYCRAVLIQFCQQAHHLGAVLRVEVTRRLIRQNQLGAEHHGAGYCHSLLLTARKLMRKVLCTMSYAHALHHLLHLLFSFSLTYLQICQGQLDVLLHVKFVNEVEALEHKAYLSLTYARAVFFLQQRHLLAVEPVLARSRVVQQSENVQQRRLAASRRTHYCHKLTVFHVERYVVKRYSLHLFRAERLAKIFYLYHILFYFMPPHGFHRIRELG